MAEQLQVIAEETAEGKRVVVTFTPVDEAVVVEQERGYR